MTETTEDHVTAWQFIRWFAANHSRAQLGVVAATMTLGVIALGHRACPGRAQRPPAGAQTYRCRDASGGHRMAADEAEVHAEGRTPP